MKFRHSRGELSAQLINTGHQSFEMIAILYPGVFRDLLQAFAFGPIRFRRRMVKSRCDCHDSHPRRHFTSARDHQRPNLEGGRRGTFGRFAFSVFSLGILGARLLAVPVLAGSAAFAIGEARKWPTGLARRPLQAKAFYATVAIATLVGVVLNFTSINLFWSAVINGVVAVPVMVLMMLLTSNTKVMGQFTVTGMLRFTGWLAAAIMAAAVAGMLVTAVP